jgi:heptosyltransferase-2
MPTEKILFIQTAFIGDAILSLPAIQKLKEIYIDCEIDVLCIPESKEIYVSSSFVSNAIVLDKKRTHKSILKTYKFVKELRKNNYTKIYSSHRSFRTAFIVLLLQVEESYGFDNASLVHVYKNLIKYSFSKHEVQRNLDLAGYKYDEQNWKIIPEINSNEDVKNKIKNFIDSNSLQSGFIAIAPGSIWETKKYPIESYKFIIDYLLNKKNKVVLIGGEKDMQLCSSLTTQFSSGIINTSGLFSITESIELLRYSKLLLSNDSAPTHFGVCADIKVLTIYCSTIPQFGFYPYNKNSSFITYNDLHCKPCGIHGYDKCPIKTFDCAKKISHQQIIAKAEEMLID